MKLGTAVALFFALAGFAGAQTFSRGGAPVDVFDMSENPFNNGTFNNSHGYTDTNNKTITSLTINTGIKNLILITAGQSNIMNIGPTLRTPTNATVIDNFNPYDSQMYAYADPLVGASNNAAHMTGRLADLFINAGTFARVISVPVAQGGSTVAQWAPGGNISNRIPAALARLKARGIVAGTNVTFALLWGQGEQDNCATSQASYTASFNALAAQVVGLGFSGRIFVAKETWSGGSICANVQAAQAAVVDNVTVFVGANADALGAGDRIADNTHWNDTGQQDYAAAWQTAMHASGAPY